MGLFKSIGKAFKSVGKAIGSVAKGVVKFAKSPFGKLLINVGLTFLTGGMGGILAKGVSMLGGLGKVGQLASTFGGFASKFLGPAQSFLSGNGLGAISGFLKNATGTGDLLSMATDIFKSIQKQPKTDPTTTDIVRENLMQLFAAQQAKLLNAA